MRKGGAEDRLFDIKSAPMVRAALAGIRISYAPWFWWNLLAFVGAFTCGLIEVAMVVRPS